MNAKHMQIAVALTFVVAAAGLTFGYLAYSAQHVDKTGTT